MHESSELDRYLAENSGKLIATAPGVSVLFAEDCVLSRVLTVTLSSGSHARDWVCFAREPEDTTGITMEFMNELGDLRTVFSGADSQRPELAVSRLLTFLTSEYKRLSAPVARW